MSLQLLINNTTDPRSDYITWTPTPCKIVSTEVGQKNVLLRNKNTNKGGQIVFATNIQPFNPVDTIQLTVPSNGSISFFIAGKFNTQTGKSFPSSDDKDAIILIEDIVSNTLVGEKALMVRVRKNANKLSKSERDRFLDAVVKLNQSGKYVELQNMHIASNDNEIHGRSCFLPWHRAFLLDLERKLQEVTPSVTIPYWNFAEKAPKLFSGDFIGLPDTTGMVSFSNTNPLINWKSQLFGAGDGTRIRRIFESLMNIPWNPATDRAVAVRNNEAQTIGLGNVFKFFATMEGDPHGSAHVSFTGQINNPGTAPADPLFFLLHCNIDRLWAKWQWLNDLFLTNNLAAYPRQGNGNPTQGGELGIGNFTNDTMWPWNKIFGAPRPPHSPGNGMPDSPSTNFPGSKPTIANVIDYQGQIALSNNLHFAYSDVPINI